MHNARRIAAELRDLKLAMDAGTMPQVSDMPGQLIAAAVVPQCPLHCTCAKLFDAAITDKTHAFYYAVMRLGCVVSCAKKIFSWGAGAGGVPRRRQHLQLEIELNDFDSHTEGEC